MARESVITKEKVAAAVAELKEAGVPKPSAGRVREHLQKKFGPGEPVGSQNKIQDFLNELRHESSTTFASAASYQVPASLAGEIARVMDGVEQKVRDEVRAALDLSAQELADMTAESRQQTLYINDLVADLASRTTERDALKGELARAVQDLQESKAELSGQQTVMSELHLALARLEANVMTANLQAETKSKEVARIAEELQKLQTELQAAQGRYVDADRRAAVSHAQLESETKARQLAEAKLTQLVSDLKDGDVVASRAAAAEAASSELRSQVTVLQRLLERPQWRHRDGGRGLRQGEDRPQPPLANS